MTSIVNNDWAQVLGKAKLECMIDGCTFKAKTWVSHASATSYDLNGVWQETGVRHKHVCPDCHDELTELFDWKRLVW